MTQKTPAQLQPEINAQIVAGIPGGITALTVNGILNDIVLSFYPIGSSASNIRIITTTGSVVLAATDVVILFQKAASGASTLYLPTSAGRSGTPIIVKDLTGDAFTNNITIVPFLVETIDGFAAASAAANGVALLDSNYQSKSLYPLSSGGWYVI